ncbi:unnamed protein product [Ascophyllum nodosum]
MFSLHAVASLLALLSLASGFHVPGMMMKRLTVPQRASATAARTDMALELRSAMVEGGQAQWQGTSSSGGSLTRGDAISRAATSFLGAGVLVPGAVAMAPREAQARKPGVNRPDLLPKEQTNVIDLMGMLTKGQAKRINKQLEDLERATGYRLRLLCQKYPDTPGLAVKDYWKVDDKTIVMVVDPGEDNNRAGGVNILNFNVGDGLRLNLPPQFWQRLQNRYGNRFYVRDNGQDAAIISAVDSINLCLKSDSGFCVDPPDLQKAVNDQAVLQSIGRGGR